MRAFAYALVGTIVSVLSLAAQQQTCKDAYESKATDPADPGADDNGKGNAGNGDACSAALAEVHRFEGTVNQLLGDGFMALFGAPVSHEDHARRAVLAAIAISLSPFWAETTHPASVRCGASARVAGSV